MDDSAIGGYTNAGNADIAVIALIAGNADIVDN
jgi:hypothetical protein